MTSIIYKAKDGYSFGWSDYRGLFGGVGTKPKKYPMNEELKSWTLEQLRCAWLLRFGSDWVNFKDIEECGDRDYMDITVLLDRKKQLASQLTVTTFAPSYKLIPDTNENR